MGYFLIGFLVVLLSIGNIIEETNGEIPQTVLSQIKRMNKRGPYLGIVAPNNYELNPLLDSKAYNPDSSFPSIDFAGRSFRFGKILNQRVVIVMCGLGMVNSGVTTQLLVSLFRLHGVLHYGIAGNADTDLEIGDVTIPKFWAHSGLWNWQRYGDGIDNELALESGGDYTRDIGYLQFSKYNNHSDNLLNRIWYQPEEIFPVTGTPEVREHIFWIPVDTSYLDLARQLEDMKLPQCVNTTCLPRASKVTIVDRGVSASVFVDNAAYRTFLRRKFNATAVEMESAAVALVCHQQNIPFIVIRSLSDLAGGGSDVSNEANIFSSLAAQNSVDVLVKFVGLLPPQGRRGYQSE
uniref:Bark storage protein A n=1 Tax=Noccaea caerulescens TaxID=107243 RepID=A0A1J3GLI8_NOCCA